AHLRAGGVIRGPRRRCASGRGSAPDDGAAGPGDYPMDPARLRERHPSSPVFEDPDRLPCAAPLRR
ncbi:LC1, partial [Symbiodinium sp. CCMP2456]